MPFKEDDTGINCRLYASLIVRALGFYVPDYYESKEWFYDPDSCLDEIPFSDEIKTGDVLGFTKEDETNLLNTHIGIAKVENGNINILHASRSAGKVICTPLSEMGEDPRHKSFVMIRRPKIEIPALYNPNYLLNLGFYS